MCRRLRKSSSMVDPLPWWIRSARQVERNPFGNVGASSMVDPFGKAGREKSVRQCRVLIHGGSARQD